MCIPALPSLLTCQYNTDITENLYWQIECRLLTLGYVYLSSIKRCWLNGVRKKAEDPNPKQQQTKNTEKQNRNTKQKQTKIRKLVGLLRSLNGVSFSFLMFCDVLPTSETDYMEYWHAKKRIFLLILMICLLHFSLKPSLQVIVRSPPHIQIFFLFFPGHHCNLKPIEDWPEYLSFLSRWSKQRGSVRCLCKPHRQCTEKGT